MQVYGLIFCDIHFGSVTICNQFIFVLMFYVICHFTFFVVYKVVDAILLFVGKENANERKESLLSICRVQLFFCKVTTFPRNFQGFREKCRDDDKEKRRLSHFENRPILFFMIEKNYFLINSHFAFPYAQAYNLISYVPSASHSQFGPPSRESSLLKSPPQAIFHFLFALNLNCPTVN